MLSQPRAAQDPSLPKGAFRAVATERHAEVLELRAHQSKAQWEEIFALTRLATSLGEDEEINDVVQWKRVYEEKPPGLDTTRLKREHPELYQEFCVPKPDTISMHIYPYRANPLAT